MTIDSHPPPDYSAEQDPSHLATQAELRANIWDTARKLLAPEAFTALWLRYAESMSAEDIGQVLGRSTNAVRILLHRARGMLQDRMNTNGQYLESNHEPR
jgi:DNA-directed RNA polymerase specialized sigma24 family protein